ncbi:MULTISPECIES: helix-turn-helix domain-containing protein [unclassified Mesorhizobium]|uniref:helix-turn-helix domain-containing protein n=1 Tax=unclassified Mesorhizobium TaxID=325217 RepID=UPI001CCD3455|nr:MULTISPECIES: helix-turn-helix domain-containing protein [unclassified Mesorhizobium]MBZ9741326.1 helix-turn-helix domain containing protein [Mesorhizobium sp. CO1-1-4]MBZ9804604.1 helix-turn-helix domain containing protein [Mesorhizobium sp. ES1-6]
MIQQELRFHSPDEILAHPAFAEARAVWIEGMLGLYENNPFLSRLLAATQRSAVFFNTLVLDAAHDPTDRSTWPTIALVQEVMAPYGVSSRRNIETIVARFVETGFLSRHEVAADRRVRLLVPTEKMVAHDLDWVRVYYSPLAAMFPGCGYAPPMRRDPIFRTAVRRASSPGLGDAVKLLANNPAITFIMNRDAGMMVLIKLVQTGAAAGPAPLDFSDLAKRFGISRTHVRRLLRDAEQEGLLGLSKASVTLEPRLVAAFDRFLADCMAGFHALFQFAMSSPEMASSTAIGCKDPTGSR